MDLLNDASLLISARGKKVVKIRLNSDNWDNDEVLAVMLGRTGLLRAPALKKGKTVIVGFNKDAFEDIF